MSRPVPVRRSWVRSCTRPRSRKTIEIFFGVPSKPLFGGFAFCVPSMGTTWRCKSSGELGRRDPERTARRPTARSSLKASGSETASRRTGTGYRRRLGRREGQMAAKPLRSKGSNVDPVIVRGKSMALSLQEISLRVRKGNLDRGREKEATAMVVPPEQATGRAKQKEERDASTSRRRQAPVT